MKTLIYLLLVTLTACNPDTPGRNNSEEEISYDVNGVHYTHSGDVYTNFGIGVSGTKTVFQGTDVRYIFSGNSSQSNQISIQIPTLSDTLRATSYHFQFPPAMIVAEGYIIGFVSSFDYLNVQITSYSNGVVNGTFSGNMTKTINSSQGITESVTISNGVIRNVKIRY